jgi:serine/threonine protein kinase
VIAADYPPFCLADPVFFERPELLPDEGERFAAAGLPAPAGWRRTESGWYVRLRPEAATPPPSGWAVDISVRHTDLGKAVEIVWGYCVDRRIPFDFVRSTTAARELNADHADRFRSGRPITLHPGDDAALTDVLNDLSLLLGGMVGPRVLGALVHGEGPLHVRHGGYDEARATEAVFVPPEGVALPAVLARDLAALRESRTEELPYRVLSALKLGNSGGTYLARTRAGGQRVVLKEARPHAGLDRHGRDAVTRLVRERHALDRLAGLGCVPRVRGLRIISGHHFLEQEYVEGTNLFAWSLRTPLTTRENARRGAAEYTRWALDALCGVERALCEVLARGMRLGELNPRNVVVRPGGEVVLVDLESATELDDDTAPAHGDPEFSVPAGLTAEQAHEYLLNCLRMAVFLPVGHADPVKLPTLVAAIHRYYPVPVDFGERVLSGLRPGGHPKQPDTAAALFTEVPVRWPELRDSLVRGIHHPSTPDRADRLFPGTPTGPRTIGGYPLGYGAAGVLYAMHRAGADIPDCYSRWLVEAVRRDEEPLPGLYDGLHGVAYTLDLLGRRQEALDVLERCRPLERPRSGDLFGGRAGIALNLLHFAAATGEHELTERAMRLVDELSREDDPLPAGPGRPAPVGLLHGATGLAALFCRVHELTGEVRYLDLAERTLRRDVDRCDTWPDGIVLLRQARTALPYLHGGSWGLAFVLPHLLEHRPREPWTTLLDGIRHTCDHIYVQHAGLFRGRAGAIATLATLGRRTNRDAIDTQVALLSWHARSHLGELAFPGFRLPRLSADLATGSAGVLLALAAAYEGAQVLPHLGSRPHAHPTTGEGGEHHDRDSRAAGTGGRLRGPVAL